METMDRLLEKSCYVIDFIPIQVPKESKGYFFEVVGFDSYGHG